MANEIVEYIEPVTPHRNRRHYSEFEKMCIVEYVIEEVENGGNVLKAMADCDCETRNFYNWIREYEDCKTRFLNAREAELLHAYEKVLEIERRMMLNPKKDPEWMHGEQAKSVLNSIFWRLERRKREVYGREIKHVHGVEDYEHKLAAARERMEARLNAPQGVVFDHVAK